MYAFMLAAARDAADLALNEQTHSMLSPRALRRFTVALDAAARTYIVLRDNQVVGYHTLAAMRF